MTLYVLTSAIIEFCWNNSMYEMLPDPIPEKWGLGHETSYMPGQPIIK